MPNLGQLNGAQHCSRPLPICWLPICFRSTIKIRGGYDKNRGFSKDGINTQFRIYVHRRGQFYPRELAHELRILYVSMDDLPVNFKGSKRELFHETQFGRKTMKDFWGSLRWRIVFPSTGGSNPSWGSQHCQQPVSWGRQSWLWQLSASSCSRQAHGGTQLHCALHSQAY